jgi:hypothetical protein
MPKGKKVCPECKTEVGVRLTICPSCNHAFQKAVKAAPPVKVEKAPEVKEAESEQVFGTTDIVPQPSKGAVFGKIITPAGACPIKLKKAGEIYTDEEVVDWAFRVKEHNSRYAVDAVVYWIREICDINSPEYHRVKGVVLDALNPYGQRT